jgi:hypothetical protein
MVKVTVKEGAKQASILAAAETCQDEGWVLVPDLVPTEAIDAAVEELWQIYPRPE